MFSDTPLIFFKDHEKSDPKTSGPIRRPTEENKRPTPFAVPSRFEGTELLIRTLMAQIERKAQTRNINTWHVKNPHSRYSFFSIPASGRSGMMNASTMLLPTSARFEPNFFNSLGSSKT